jgi:hypothetical protein
MTLRTAYSRTLSETLGTAGSDWQYAINIPGADILESGTWCQLEFSGAGLTAAYAWAGHKGSGATDFDGNQKAFPFAGSTGNTSFPASGPVKSDPVQLTVVAGQPFIVRYDAKASGTYRRQGSLSGYNLYYTAGSGGTGNGATAKSYGGPSANVTAMVTKIIVGDSLADFGVTEPPPSGGGTTPPATTSESSEWRRNAILAGRHYSSGDDVLLGQSVASTTFTADKNLNFILINPTGSAELLQGDELTFTPVADCVISLRVIDPVPTVELIGSRCNTRFAADSDYSTSKLHKFLSTGVVGNKHGIYRVSSGQTLRLTDYALLYPGYNLMLSVHTPGVGGTCNMTWVEKPA